MAGTPDRSAAARKGWDTRRGRGAAIRLGEESSDAGAVVVPQQQGAEPESVDGVKFGTNVVSVGLTLDLRADYLVDQISKALLVHHHDAISSGQSPKGGPQRPLSEGRRHDSDRESPHRGYKTGRLAEGLRRGKITGSTASARTKIMPPTDRNVFVATELERGVIYLSTEGAAGEVAVAAAAEAVDAIASGKKLVVDRGGD